jgi:type I restriction enzyme S subunit
VSWPLAALGDIAPAKPIKLNGYTPDDKIWQVTLDQIESNTGLLLEKSIKPLSEAGSSTHAFDNRHVLYSKLRPYLNKVLLPDGIGLGTTELVPMLPASDRLNRDYLAHYLKSKVFVNWISSQTAGAKMPRVSMNTFWAHEIPLPPLTEQKRIAAILDKADSLRRKNQQAIQLADQFLRAVFLELFGKLFCDKGYQLAYRKPISELTTYIDYRGKTPEKSEYGVPLITAKNVKKGYVSEDPREYIPESNYEVWMTRGHPLENDVLFTTEAPLGNVALLGKYEKVAVGQRLVSLRSKGELTQEYLLFCLLNPFVQNLIEQKSSGSTAKGIRTKELWQIELPIPDIKEQNKFSIAYRKAIVINRKNALANYSSDELFNALSQKAFAGEL